ncbi:M23 family metallopeptidase [Nocardia donostiensis]|uniref:Peptidase n=1 Tax=Nocardia donostiensis TaxID=1538463 RepID=A0A1W0AQY9_9NOCA|nr:M23 family metallopeptidase [Nocardia donostiensis]ONM48360.1 peptidase [Nocardia donostiensis]OQS12646.1 peptidase [Nocardia donostiensis]OQS20530.1 peptidase [Nocardia donostiensis]
MNHHTTLAPTRSGLGNRHTEATANDPATSVDGAASDPHAGTNDFWAANGSWADTQVWPKTNSWPQSDTQTRWTAEQSWSKSAAWDDSGAWAEGGGAWAESGGSWAEGDSWNDDTSWRDDDSPYQAPDAAGGTDDSSRPESLAAPTVIPARHSRHGGGAHRVPAPPTALKGRAAVAAVAAGAFVAAGQCALASPEQNQQAVDYEASGQIHEIAAQSVSTADPAAVSTDSPQVLNVGAPVNLEQFEDILEKGAKYAEDLAAAEAAKLRPLFARFASGNFTSGYGARWGVQHLGIDVAAPIGTPIYAVADGTVIDAGPAAGFGMWVRLLHADGTITVYGHIDTATVSPGQEVLAGDQIATMGNRGFSTGPHVHFEVWLNGVDKIDPVPWLATRGISLGVQRD